MHRFRSPSRSSAEQAMQHNLVMSSAVNSSCKVIQPVISGRNEQRGERRMARLTTLESHLERVANIYRANVCRRGVASNGYDVTETRRLKDLLKAIKKRFDPLRDSLYFKEELERYLSSGQASRSSHE